MANDEPPRRRSSKTPAVPLMSYDKRHTLDRGSLNPTASAKDERSDEPMVEEINWTRTATLAGSKLNGSRQSLSARKHAVSDKAKAANEEERQAGNDAMPSDATAGNGVAEEADVEDAEKLHAKQRRSSCKRDASLNLDDISADGLRRSKTERAVAVASRGRKSVDLVEEAGGGVGGQLTARARSSGARCRCPRA